MNHFDSNSDGSAAAVPFPAGGPSCPQLWDIRDAVLLHKSEILCAAVLTAVAFDPSVPRLIIGAADGIVRFYDVASASRPRLLAALDLPHLLKKRAQAEADSAAVAAAAAADAPRVIGSRNPAGPQRAGALLLAAGSLFRSPRIPSHGMSRISGFHPSCRTSSLNLPFSFHFQGTT